MHNHHLLPFSNVQVEGGRKPHIIRYQLSKALKPYMQYRESMFERVYPINEKLADRMIAVGYKQPSRFGRWCPVQVRCTCIMQLLPDSLKVDIKAAKYPDLRLTDSLTMHYLPSLLIVKLYCVKFNSIFPSPCYSTLPMAGLLSRPKA